LIERASGEDGREERDVTLQSIEPRGTHEPCGFDSIEDAKWVGFRCGCQDPEVPDTDAAGTPIVRTLACDACACEQSVDECGAESFLNSADIKYGRTGTLVVKGRVVWEFGQTIDGDYYYEDFEVVSLEWLP